MDFFILGSRLLVGDTWPVKCGRGSVLSKVRGERGPTATEVDNVRLRVQRRDWNILCNEFACFCVNN